MSESFSVGRLLQMKSKDRTKLIRDQMSPEVRRRLTHLASLGAQKKLDEAMDYHDLITELTVWNED